MLLPKPVVGHRTPCPREGYTNVLPLWKAAKTNSPRVRLPLKSSAAWAIPEYARGGPPELGPLSTRGDHFFQSYNNPRSLTCTRSSLLQSRRLVQHQTLVQFFFYLYLCFLTSNRREVLSPSASAESVKVLRGIGYGLSASVMLLKASWQHRRSWGRTSWHR